MTTTATTIDVQDLPPNGIPQQGDRIVGERVAGTTNLFTVPYNIMTGVPNSITITNGDGSSGNPTFSVSATYGGGTSISTVGTITTGTWNGSAVPVASGGTGLTSLTSYSVLCGGTTGTGNVQPLASVGDLGQVLTSGGAGALPSWQDAAVPPVAGAAGKILQSNGTNFVASTPTWPTAASTARKMVVSDGTNLVMSTETWAVPGTANNFLVSNGTNWTAVGPTGNGTPVMNTSPTLTTPILGAATATSINFGASTTNGIIGVTTNNSAASGVVGEIIEQVVLTGAAVSITSNSTVQITNISIPAGDWDIDGVLVIKNGGATVSRILAAVNNSAALPNAGQVAQGCSSQIYAAATVGDMWVPTGTARMSFASATFVYLMCNSQATGGAPAAYGAIRARRVR